MGDIYIEVVQATKQGKLARSIYKEPRVISIRLDSISVSRTLSLDKGSSG